MEGVSIHVEGWSLPLVKHGVLGPGFRIAPLARKETNYGGIKQSKWIVQFYPVKGISSEDPDQSIVETNEADICDLQMGLRKVSKLLRRNR